MNTLANRIATHVQMMRVRRKIGDRLTSECYDKYKHTVGMTSPVSKAFGYVFEEHKTVRGADYMSLLPVASTINSASSIPVTQRVYV